MPPAPRYRVRYRASRCAIHPRPWGVITKPGRSHLNFTRQRPSRHVSVQDLPTLGPPPPQYPPGSPLRELRHRFETPGQISWHALSCNEVVKTHCTHVKTQDSICSQVARFEIWEVLFRSSNFRATPCFFLEFGLVLQSGIRIVQ